MKVNHGLMLLSVLWLLTACDRSPASAPTQARRHTNIQSFVVNGTIEELKPGGLTAVIRHEAISNYMDAMTMPFHARVTNELAGLLPGDIVSFRLSVTDDESWIDQVKRMGRAAGATATNFSATPPSNEPPRINIVEGLATFAFTNEFGQPLNFGDFKGQAIGLTFIFTRCPLPEYCPRLTKNFASATKKLQSLPESPTNWHFFSISFDPQVDTPPVLRGYAKSYGYDSNRWSFVTGSQATIDEVARRFNFNFKKEGGTFTHHFFTVVLDANGYWHAGWPVGGDTSDNLVQEMIQAARPSK